MKRVWIVCGIVLSILLLSGLSLWHLSVVTTELDERLQQLSDAVDQKDAGLETLAADFESLWEDRESMMMRYIHHDELDAITGTVARLKALAAWQDYPELAAEIDRLQHLVRHIFESELPTIMSIF